MKKYYIMLAALVFAACGAPDETTMDRGSVAILDHDNDVASLPGDPRFTGEPEEFGQDSQPWVSDLYHGNDHGEPCYGATSNGQSCVFPQFKQVNITFSASSTVCTQSRDYILAHGGTANEWAQMILSLETGFTSLSGVGSGVLIKENNATGTNMTITADCEHADSELGEFFDTFSTTQIVNLPSVGGVDPSSALYEVPSMSHLLWSIENMWDFVTRPTTTLPNGGCGFGTVSNPARLQKLKEFALHAGKHETLHMLGFGHFKSGLMAPGEGCNDPPNSIDVPTGFGQALGEYSGGAGGPTVHTGTINPTSVP